MREILDFLKKAWVFINRHGRIWWLVLGLLVGMLFNIMPMIMMIMGGLGMETGMPKFPTAVELALVKSQDLDDSAAVTGSLQAEEGVTLKSEVTGQVMALPLQEGTRVEKGTVLVVLDDKASSANLAEARARARLAARNHTRLKQLRDEDPDLVSQRDYDNAISELDVAQAAVKVAEAAYAKTHIAAPFSGTVGIRRVSVGDFVNPGQDLVSLQAVDNLKIDFSLPERFAPTLAPGQPVAVRVDALGGELVSATVTAVDPLVTPGSRNVGVRALVDNPDGKLRPGMFVRVDATLDRREGALVIPEEAVIPEGNDKYVYKIENRKAVKTKVELGMRTPGSVEVVSGLKQGDIVVIGGQIKLSDGAEVVATNMTLPEAVSATVPEPQK